LHKALSFLVCPTVLAVLLWVGLSLALLFGPIAYPDQPALQVLAIITTGLLVFGSGHWVGTMLAPGGDFAKASSPFPTDRELRVAIVLASGLGILGIGLIALDRLFFSGVANDIYAPLLRCAPELIEFVAVTRTPLIYFGYATFSLAYGAFALFLLRAEEIRGWPALVAQLAIISPVIYALLYSGRMPILLLIAITVSTLLIRVYQGRRLIPNGHFLIPKLLILTAVFVVYSNNVWASRRDYCERIKPAVEKLRTEMYAGKERRRIDATIWNGRPFSQTAIQSEDEQWTRLVLVLEQNWGVYPRAYLNQAVDSQLISVPAAESLISNYFYLTHGMATLQRIWDGRDKLEPFWGIYEVGVLSPLIRIFAPEAAILNRMNEGLQETGLYGFFPSVWGAALLDFGVVGGAGYIFLWGLVGGWAFAGSRQSRLVTPPLMLAFTLATVLLSSVQGPLGLANSALVAVSFLLLGSVLDLGVARWLAKSPRTA
jgi:hypothetical protein